MADDVILSFSELLQVGHSKAVTKPTLPIHLSQVDSKVVNSLQRFGRAP